MSHRSSVVRSSARYSPYLRSPAAGSARPSPSPSGLLPPPEPLSNHSAANHLAEVLFPPLSTPNFLPRNSTDWDSCVPLSLDSQPISTEHQSELYASSHRLIDPAWSPLYQSPSVVANRDPDPTLSHVPHHSLLNSQTVPAVRPSTAISQPEDLIYQNYSVHQYPHQFTPGSLLTQQALTRQGPTYNGEGMFSKSQNFSVNNSTFVDNSTASDNFMKEFLQHTIIGAEYDSSARYPPPRCHPGTRLATVHRCKAFITQCYGEEKMRWVVGPAGVGKSAIMQMVAEETPADASVFLSVNGRQDGTKTFTTIAYQLAAKYELYHQFIRKEVNRDPTLLRKALLVQFQKFIVNPFIHQHLFNPSHRFVVVIDGLDECDDLVTQEELLELISNFCLLYPTSPIVWFVASRPEPHITSFFDDARVAPAYAKEEIQIDSDEACEDVQLYLRDELAKIKRAYPTLKRKREWPSELEFTKIATAAGGLFAYASTVLRYIGDRHFGDPVSQLTDVLIAIDTGPKEDVLRRNNPLALLDALYQRIMSKIPDAAMINTRKLILVHSAYGSWLEDSLRKLCNRLGLTEDAAYGAVRHLHAVMRVPVPEKADNEHLTYFHKSFKDFLFDFKRSGFSSKLQEEVWLLQAQSSLRIVEQIPSNFHDVAFGEGIECHGYGYLRASPGFCDNLSLSWPADERFTASDRELRLNLYRDSVCHVCDRFTSQKEFSWNIFYFHVLTTRFATLGPYFPIESVRDSVFDNFRSELMDLGKLKQVPLRSLDYAAICGMVSFRFTNTGGRGTTYSNPWNSTCKHQKRQLAGSQPRQGWTTGFERALTDVAAQVDIPRFEIKAGSGSHRECVDVTGGYECLYCSRRFARYLSDNPSQLATVFVDSTEMCYVELVFVDADDGISEWRYRFCHSGPPLCM